MIVPGLGFESRFINICLRNSVRHSQEPFLSLGKKLAWDCLCSSTARPSPRPCRPVAAVPADLSDGAALKKSALREKKVGVFKTEYFCNEARKSMCHSWILPLIL